ncbi:MAG: hypothetical protein AAF328_01060 [Planctomycetota bacterium]
MSKAARVLDVQEMAAFRALLVKVAEATRNGVAAGDAEVRDMHRWLTQEQPQVWGRRIKKLERLLADAKETLRRKQSTPTPTGEPPNVMLEKNQVRRAKAMLEEAKARAERTRMWARRFEREESVYRGATNGARSAAQSTLPGAIRSLDELLGHLEDYLRLTSSVSSEAEADHQPEDASVARSASEPTQPDPTTDPGVEPSPAADESPTQGGAS